jgi:16S rRNA (guanine(966)-N(2))-methyltransferase RsmD
MRVITGKARGMRLKSFEGRDVRPTTDRVKEAIFSAVQFYIDNSNVLDLFAGTGQLGIEALSRGAKNVTFVDNSTNSINLVKSNLTTTKFNDLNVQIYNEESLSFLERCSDKFDIVFLDPPYRKGIIIECLNRLSKSLNDSAFVFCEHEKELILPETIDGLQFSKTYKFGKIYISLYRFYNEVNV